MSLFPALVVLVLLLVFVPVSLHPLFVSGSDDESLVQVRE